MFCKSWLQFYKQERPVFKFISQLCLFVFMNLKHIHSFVYFVFEFLKLCMNFRILHFTILKFVNNFTFNLAKYQIINSFIRRILAGN